MIQKFIKINAKISNFGKKLKISKTSDFIEKCHRLKVALKLKIQLIKSTNFDIFDKKSKNFEIVVFIEKITFLKDIGNPIKENLKLSTDGAQQKQFQCSGNKNKFIQLKSCIYNYSLQSCK